MCHLELFIFKCASVIHLPSKTQYLTITYVLCVDVEIFDWHLSYLLLCCSEEILIDDVISHDLFILLRGISFSNFSRLAFRIFCFRGMKILFYSVTMSSLLTYVVSFSKCFGQKYFPMLDM